MKEECLGRGKTFFKGERSTQKMPTHLRGFRFRGKPLNWSEQGQDSEGRERKRPLKLLMAGLPGKGEADQEEGGDGCVYPGSKERG